MNCFVLDTFLRGGGRIFRFGDSKQLSCFSSLGLRRYSALDATLCKQLILDTTYRLQSFVGEITAQTMYLEENLRVASTAGHCNFVCVEVEATLSDREQSIRCSTRSAAIEVGIVHALSAELSSLGSSISTSTKMHYVSFYGDQKRMFQALLGRAPLILKGILSVDGCQGLDTDTEVL